MFFSELAIEHSTAQPVGTKKIDGLPEAKAVKRAVLHRMMLENGMDCSFQIATEDDVGLVQSILKAAEAKNKNKQYLLPRTDEQVLKMIRDGFVMLAILNGNQGAGVMGADDVDDENDSGRGAPYTGCDFKKQICMKGAGIHPAANGLNLYAIARPYRMAGTMERFPEKTCILTKTNNPFVKYTHREELHWDLADIYSLDKDVTIPIEMFNSNWDNDSLLHTYVTCQKKQITKLANENMELIERSSVLQGLYDHYHPNESKVYAVA